MTDSIFFIFEKIQNLRHQHLDICSIFGSRQNPVVDRISPGNNLKIFFNQICKIKKKGLHVYVVIQVVAIMYSRIRNDVEHIV